MEAENLIFNHSCKWKVVEEFCELFPDVCVAILPQTLIIESVSIHNRGTRLMIMSLWYENLNTDRTETEPLHQVYCFDLIKECKIFWSDLNFYELLNCSRAKFWDLHLSNLSALVVTSENGESILEADLQGNKKSHSLDWIVTTVDIIAHEQIVCVRRLSTNFEEFSEVMELTMDISADCDGSTHLLDVRLINKDFFRLNRIQKLTDVQNCLVSLKSATNVPPITFLYGAIAAQKA